MKPRRSLQDRILNSFCRQCGRKGHWRAECPYRQGSTTGSSGTGGSQPSSGSAPTSTVTVDQADDMMPLEFMMIPETPEPALDVPLPCYVNECMGGKGYQTSFWSRSHGESNKDNGDRGIVPLTAMQRVQAWSLRNECNPDTAREIRPTADLSLTALVKARVHRLRSNHPTMCPKSSRCTENASDHAQEHVCFASQGPCGVLDLGASKTVIGSECLPELIRSLDASTRQGLRRTSCNITFRFGNQATLTSQHAIVLPLGNLMWKIAVVPGGTPFLISNTLMRALKAQINCDTRTLTSPMLHVPVGLTLTSRGLFLLDVNQLVKSANAMRCQGHSQSVPKPAETFMSDESEVKSPIKDKHVSFKVDCPQELAQNNQHNQDNFNTSSLSNTTPEIKCQQDASCTVNQHDQTQMKSESNFQRPPCHADENKQEPGLPSSPAQIITERSPPNFPTECHGDVVDPALASAADSEQCAHREPGAPDDFGVSHRSDFLRDQAPRQDVRRCMEGHRMGDVHAEPISDQHQRKPQEIHQVHRTEDCRHGERTRDHTQGLASSAQSWSPNGQSQDKANGQKSGNPVAHLFAGWRGRLGHRAHRVRDVYPGDYECPTHGHGRGLECTPTKDAQHGECTHTSDPLHREPVDAEPGVPPARCAVREDWESDAFTAMHNESYEVKRMVNMIMSELQQAKCEVKPMGPRWDLGEIMCSEKSPLTQQVLNANGQAFRFGLSQGDVSTPEGRQLLFQKIVRHRPKHIWYSPTCGPWSSWSQLNASRSLFHQELYQNQRRQLLYQLSLGIVLYRHQVGNGDHFHWEQPQRSLMFKHPSLAEIQMHTQACQFDMCRAGDLRCPETKVHMKKGMSILTTHAPLYERFHGMSCDNRHPHQPIEGSCHNQNGETTLRTKFTEVYPRKFARSIAQIILKRGKWWPYHWQPGMSLTCDARRPCGPADTLAVSNKFRAKPKFALSELVSPSPHAMPGVKRAKLDKTESGKPSMETCKELVKRVDQLLPRVGKREITDPEALQQVQSMFSEKQIVKVVSCRGTERTIGPPQQMHPQEAPYRKMILLRRNGDIQYEKNWEHWVHLAKRQLVRPSHASRINITMFAREKNQTGSAMDRTSVNEPASEMDEASNVPVPSSIRENVSAEEPMTDSPEPPRQVDSTRALDSLPREAEETSSVPPPEPKDEDPGTPQPVHPEKSVETQLEHQSFRFRSLPRWEQQTILRMHKNLGHPSNDRLARALQINGARAEVVQAALEIRCAICAANAPPKHARPATLKPLLDFNHKVYVDGITWSNSQGKQFHMYHMLDAGSNFHVAIASPSQTSESLVDFLHQHWISWAGPPNELVVDSGTEMNSEYFSGFLQRFNIKSQTICPEAHWQAGKIERHGSFLESMLSKIDLEYPITDYQSLQMALNQSTHAKNSLSIRHGYAPEIIVFGKHARLPGSIISDESIPSHEQATQEDAKMEPNGFKAMLQIREAARKAFHAADNSDVLRRAALRRACPNRGTFRPGEWVMTWRSNNLHQHQWFGPHKVIVQEGNTTVWCTSSGKLFRSAPENTRRAYPEEGHPEGPDLPENMTAIQQLIQRHQNNPNLTDPITIPDNLPEDETRSNPQNNPQQDELHQGPNTQESDSNHGSGQQPDQEPENITPEDSQQELPETPCPEDDPAEPTEMVMLTCHEEDNALSCSDAKGLAWKCEFNFRLDSALDDHVPSENESWLMLATASKKQRTEVKLSSLTPDEVQEFEQAKQSEIQNWIKTGTISAIFRNEIPEEQILRCRWILTWKPIDNTGQTPDEIKTNRTHKPKARLVVLGYLDPKIEEIPRDSPTLNKTSRMLALQIISSHSWQLRSFDIKAAFLQGQPQSDRVIAVDPVPELRKALNLSSSQICKLNKGAYGLIDAPFLWYCALVTELNALGFEASPFDPCFFVLRSPATADSPEKLEGVLGIHVDDGIGGGSTVYEEKIKLLEKKFPFGSHKVSAFTFTGIEINQQGDHSITLNQSAYVRKIPSINIECNRKTQPSLKINEKERLSLRALVGSLQYAAINTRPDLSSKLSFLQSAINTATIETLQEANRVLHEAKRHHDVTITIRPIPPKDFRFMAFSDVSFSSTNKPDSHAGSIIVGTHKDINNNCQCPISPITWGCRKIQKVVTSTLSAETMALASTLDHLSWLRLFWAWIHNSQTQWKKPEDTLPKLEPAISVPTKPEESDLAVTDCKSLCDLVTRTATPACAEFRVQLVARAIKESLREGTIVRWVHGGAQLADALTKAMESHFLRETLKLGSYRLCDETATLKERAKTKDRLRWLRMQPDTEVNSQKKN